MKVLVFGGRDYFRTEALYAQLDGLKSTHGDRLILIQGGANGADRLAKRWGYEQVVHCAQVDAYWNRTGSPAGPRRNSAMLLLQPDLAIQLPGGRGTADMRAKLDHEGIKVQSITDT